MECQIENREVLKKISELLDSNQHESVILGVTMAVGMGLDWLNQNMDYSGGATIKRYYDLAYYRCGRVVLMMESNGYIKKWSYFYTYQMDRPYWERFGGSSIRPRYYDLGE